MLANESPLTIPVGWLLADTGWLTAMLRGGFGVLDLDTGALPSPSLTSDSMVRSRLPLRPFRTFALRLSSIKPMSLSCASFESNSLLPPPTLAPNTLDCLLTRIGSLKPFTPFGEIGGEAGSDLCILTAEDVLRSPNPNLFAGFGGRGGG